MLRYSGPKCLEYGFIFKGNKHVLLSCSAAAGGVFVQERSLTEAKLAGAP